jgi:hypothetical protein
MATIKKKALTGSTNGRMIKVVAVGTPGTLIHTAVAGVGPYDEFDEIWIWAVNSDSTNRKLTIEYGGVAAPDDLIEQTIPAEAGLMLIVPGLLLNNTLVVRAFAAAANVVMVGGFVNNISA